VYPRAGEFVPRIADIFFWERLERVIEPFSVPYCTRIDAFRPGHSAAFHHLVKERRGYANITRRLHTRESARRENMIYRCGCTASRRAVARINRALTMLRELHHHERSPLILLTFIVFLPDFSFFTFDRFPPDALPHWPTTHTAMP
jgi:hypothetical protein